MSARKEGRCKGNVTPLKFDFYTSFFGQARLFLMLLFFVVVVVVVVVAVVVFMVSVPFLLKNYVKFI